MNRRTFYITRVAALSALSVILMFLSKLLPPFLVPFYKFDFSDIAALIGGFSLGPVAAAVVVVVKTLVNLAINGTDSNFIGEAAMILFGIAFTFPGAFIYKYNRTKKGAFLGVVAGTAALCLFGCLINAYLLIPMYAGIYHTDVAKIVSMGAKAIPAVSSYALFILLITLPFNLIKGAVMSAVTMFIYKPISPLLKQK